MATVVTAMMSSIDDYRVLLKEQMDGLSADKAKLYQTIHKLDTMWEGPAHEEFTTGCIHDVKQLEELLKTGEKINAFEELAVREYDSADADVEQKVGALKK